MTIVKQALRKHDSSMSEINFSNAASNSGSSMRDSGATGPRKANQMMASRVMMIQYLSAINPWSSVKEMA